MTGRDGYGEDATVTVVLSLLVWLAAVAAVALIDLGAYLVAASRAQALADAAALAAVSADAPGATGSPRAEAQRIATAGSGRLEACACAPARMRATVAVSVEVPGLVMPRLGADRVRAEASAVLGAPAGADAAR